VQSLDVCQTSDYELTSQHIAEFQWSPDGKTLAVARGQNTSDVVLLQEIEHAHSHEFPMHRRIRPRVHSIVCDVSLVRIPCGRMARARISGAYLRRKCRDKIIAEPVKRNGRAIDRGAAARF